MRILNSVMVFQYKAAICAETGKGGRLAAFLSKYGLFFLLGCPGCAGWFGLGRHFSRRQIRTGSSRFQRTEVGYGNFPFFAVAELDHRQGGCYLKNLTGAPFLAACVTYNVSDFDSHCLIPLSFC